VVGQTLSHYRIIEKIGQGSMGEVYRAEDSRLDRKVALKILPEHLSERADLRERFEREARAVSSLNHPHICTLYDIGEQDGIHYLVMEHQVGETLAARLELKILWIIAASKPRWSFALTAPFLPVAIVGHLIMVPRFGSLGAAAVTTSVACMGALASVLAVRHVWQILPSVTTLLRSVLLSGLAFSLAVLCYLFRSLFTRVFTGAQFTGPSMNPHTSQQRQQDF